MSKKALYIPTEEDISILQKIKANNDINKVNIYGYLVAKAIEKAIIDYSFLRYKDIPVISIHKKYLIQIMQNTMLIYVINSY